MRSYVCQHFFTDEWKDQLHAHRYLPGLDEKEMRERLAWVLNHTLHHIPKSSANKGLRNVFTLIKQQTDRAFSPSKFVSSFILQDATCQANHKDGVTTAREMANWIDLMFDLEVEGSSRLLILVTLNKYGLKHTALCTHTLSLSPLLRYLANVFPVSRTQQFQIMLARWPDIHVASQGPRQTAHLASQQLANHFDLLGVPFRVPQFDATLFHPFTDA